VTLRRMCRLLTHIWVPDHRKWIGRFAKSLCKGWTLCQVRGMSLHNLRFRGQRIVYELATQEMYVSYNGYGGEDMMT
jgi:Copper amine oxidase, enzyme domain